MLKVQAEERQPTETIIEEIEQTLKYPRRWKKKKSIQHNFSNFFAREMNKR
jgi:hypothetical protein